VTHKLLNSLTIIFLNLLTVPAIAAAPILHGQVYLIDDYDQLRAAPNVTVRIEGRGDPTTTLSEGEFELPLPIVRRDRRDTRLFQAGERITLLVEKPGWVIQSPVDGEIRIPDDLEKETVKIRLVPKGSHKLWSQERFQKFIEGLQDKVKAQVKPQGKPEDLDFGIYLKEWASKLGFSADEAKLQVDKWAAETNEARDPFVRALGEYYKKNFGEARKLFRESAEMSLQELREREEKSLQTREKAVVDC
jgi:hypothetical protein